MTHAPQSRTRHRTGRRGSRGPARDGPRRTAPTVRAARRDGLAAVQEGRPWKLRDTMTTDRAWEGFLRGQDLLWSKVPTLWYAGPFLGDGLLGTMVYQEPNTQHIRFTVQHGRVQDHRPEFGSGWGTARLPVGHLTLEPVGTITAVDWRLSLWNAELTGTVTTTSRGATPAHRPVPDLPDEEVAPRRRGRGPLHPQPARRGRDRDLPSLRRLLPPGRHSARPAAAGHRPRHRPVHALSTALGWLEHGAEESEPAPCTGGG